MSVDADLTDSELVARMARGDRSGLATLYLRHAAVMLALATAILQDREGAEDLVHDVFLEAWAHSAEYSEARGAVRGWLLVRTRSRALDRLKSGHRRRVVLDESLLEAGPTQDSSLDELTRLNSLLGHLPETQREVLLLGYFEGLSASEIAERIRAPLGTVKTRIRGALAALRSRLTEDKS